jgi:hypothetical protein
MAFIQDAMVSHAAGNPSEVVRKEGTENEIKFRNLQRYLN